MVKKSIYAFLLLVVFFITDSTARVIILEGKYQNKNIYIQNGLAGSGVGFCSYEIEVNGQITADEVDASWYEIDLAKLQLQFGQDVVIEITHKDDCSPRILNPEALRPKASFELTNMSVTDKGVLNWSTTNEGGSLPFIIEQFKWNKWVKVGEVNGVGTPKENSYSMNVSLHSGENKFRLKQIGYGGLPKYTRSVSCISNQSTLTFTASRGFNEVFFSDQTMFEVYDAYGQVVKKGFGKTLNVNSLKKGSYFLCYDNTVAEFKKK